MALNIQSMLHIEDVCIVLSYLFNHDPMVDDNVFDAGRRFKLASLLDSKNSEQYVPWSKVQGYGKPRMGHSIQRAAQVSQHCVQTCQ